MNSFDMLLKIIVDSGSPKFKNEKLVCEYAAEILDIHSTVMREGKVSRKVRRRIKKIWKHNFPYDLYQQIGINQGLHAPQIEMIVSAK